MYKFLGKYVFSILLVIPKSGVAGSVLVELSNFSTVVASLYTTNNNVQGSLFLHFLVWKMGSHLSYHPSCLYHTHTHTHTHMNTYTLTLTLSFLLLNGILSMLLVISCVVFILLSFTYFTYMNNSCISIVESRA